MGPRGTAAVAMGLWVFVTAVLALDPEDVVVPGRCVLSHYRSLDPQALVAVKALRDHYVSDVQTPDPRILGPPGSETTVLIPRALQS